MKEHKLDASGEVLGRLATKIANLLRGKEKTEFVYNQNVGDKVTVVNAAKIRVTGQKLEQKNYYRHSGYLGKLKTSSLQEIFKKDPTEVVKKAVYGMLPTNKLRNSWMKNLKIYEYSEQ